jgi:lytic murein transglycosylase
MGGSLLNECIVSAAEVAGQAPAAAVSVFAARRGSASLRQSRSETVGSMQATRRAVTVGLSALLLAACGGGMGGGAGAGPAPQVMRPVPNAGYDAWVAAFRPRAEAKGISPATLDIAFRSAGFLPDVIDKDRNQTEFTRSLEDYLAIAASEERVSKGRAALRAYGPVLAEIEARYGVEPNVVVAVWGLESSYGERRGDVPVISALSTLAYDGRRGAFFEQQLVAALKILQNGDTTPSSMTGSWAGAMGHTQFIPTSYLAYAVDFTGDGRRDIWSDDPTDALASTAAYLARSGWTRGQPWGVEVTLPAGFNMGQTGRGRTRSTAAWADQGVRDMSGRPVPNYGAAAIIAPSGASGPAFMIFGNFAVIARYNNAESYVIGVGHLSDRLAGGPPVQGTFPPDAQGMTIADRQELQRKLTAAGFDTGGTDGVIGPKTRAAISAFQQNNGLAVTGEPTLALLEALR